MSKVLEELLLVIYFDKFFFLICGKMWSFLEVMV